MLKPKKLQQKTKKKQTHDNQEKNNKRHKTLSYWNIKTRLNPILTLNLCHPNPKSGIPLLMAEPLGFAMLNISLPVDDCLKIFPVRHSDTHILSSRLNTQKTWLL